MCAKNAHCPMWMRENSVYREFMERGKLRLAKFVACSFTIP